MDAVSFNHTPKTRLTAGDLKDLKEKNLFHACKLKNLAELISKDDEIILGKVEIEILKTLLIIEIRALKAERYAYRSEIEKKNPEGFTGRTLNNTMLDKMLIVCLIKLP